MELEEKYYTPKLEDFHVGFKYEYRVLSLINSKIPDDITLDEYMKGKPKMEAKWIETVWTPLSSFTEICEKVFYQGDKPIFYLGDKIRARYDERK